MNSTQQPEPGKHSRSSSTPQHPQKQAAILLVCVTLLIVILAAISTFG